MAVLNILICGGGCGGPSLALWLARAGHRVTIVERFPALRANGAQIDLRAQGIQIAKRMGLIDAIRSKVVDEEGVALVDRNGSAGNRVFLANKSGKGAQSLSSEFEIMRGDFVRILYDATKDDVKYIFGKTVEHFEQDEKSVTVRFSDGETGTYDILVGADGQGSRIRSAILPPDADPIKHIGVYLSYWQVPTLPSDNKIAKAYLAPGGRVIFTRSHSPIYSQASFMVRDDSPEMRTMPKGSVDEQKKFWMSRFEGAGWDASRLSESMPDSDYFYSQEVIQVRTKTWSKGRVVLLADAAHCPSPMSGMGTTSALAGAYVLAGEITENSDDIDRAFSNYDKKLRPFVDKLQKNPKKWLLSLIIPSSQLGINIMLFVLSAISFLRIPKLATMFSKEEEGGWKVPEYPILNKISAAATKS